MVLMERVELSILFGQMLLRHLCLPIAAHQELVKLLLNSKFIEEGLKCFIV